ncbi:hypothetical protein RND71_038057 [Anisodus tanguticus]|uniref:Uncharacterized protein n=1 Tax=Anisodus tanguticus TaxID=243964 RepID=A0AAE1QZS9_9SOLA|nr:hypothetical protein RND71_038057 [Anisodus tanguticus]
MKLPMKGMHDEVDKLLKQTAAHVSNIQQIVQNRQYSAYCQADEYDYDDGPRRKIHKSADIANRESHILTREERSHFCFENPMSPKRLVVAIENLLTYHYQSGNQLSLVIAAS